METPGDLFLSALASETRDAWLASVGEAATGAAVERLLRAGKAQWPGWSVSEATFAEALAQAVEGQPPDVASLERLCAADLYLAQGCVAGDPRALAALEHHVMPEVRRSLQRLRLGATETQEVLQRLRARLLGGAQRSALRGYRGRGELASWLRVAAAREALRVIKPQPDAPGYGDDELLARVPAPGDLELTGLKEGVAELAKSALESALTALAPKDRTLLRHHYLDGLTLDQLAGLHRVHRATVARWLQHARHSVLEGTRQRLRAALDTDESEAASLLRLVQSRFDVTLPRLLRDSRP